MSQQRLGNDEFLTQVTALFQSTHTAQHGSVFLTQKSLLTSDAAQPQILVRATNGKTILKKSSKVPASKIRKRHTPEKKVKLATVVDADRLDTFYTKYAEACKKGMEGLRKRDKKKAKEKAKAKKKGKGQAAVRASIDCRGV